MTTMRSPAYIAALGLVLCSPVTLAYLEPTHRVITESAFDRSVLQTTPTVLQDMGLSLSSLFPNTKGSPRTTRELLSDGADFEDSLFDFEDSIFPTFRSLRHFYNPVTGEGLSIPSLLLPAQTSSPDWALARPGGISFQTRSYWNARQSLFDALTKPTKEERDAAFGKTFQFLGQVVHHLQDMAQPQHVRNDGHFALTNRSRYESWTGKDDVGRNLPKDPGPAGYDITSPAFTATFNSPRRFWNTVDPSLASPATGMGIAEFTNRNFVSQGTNFDKPDLFPSPILDQSKRSSSTLQELCLNASPSCPPELSQRTDQITFFGSTIRDNFLGPNADRENPKASSSSIFDQDLIDRGSPPLFSLNRFTFQAAHDFLIPRAVAYSAGMINYFFRGKLEYVRDQAAGVNRLRNLGTEDMSGIVDVYYDAVDGNRYRASRIPVTLPVSDPNKPGDGIAVELSLQRDVNQAQLDPAPNSPSEFMLVFNGNMGEEKLGNGFPAFGAIVAAKIACAEIFLRKTSKTTIVDDRGPSGVFKETTEEHTDVVVRFNNQEEVIASSDGSSELISALDPTGSFRVFFTVTETNRADPFLSENPLSLGITDSFQRSDTNPIPLPPTITTTSSRSAVLLTAPTACYHNLSPVN
jgi:hypothetical protein